MAEPVGEPSSCPIWSWPTWHGWRLRSGSASPSLPENPPLGPQAEQQRLFESVASACAVLIARGRTTSRGPVKSPLLLVIEDVHWADGGTLAILRHLARRSRTARLKLLLVLTYRESMLDEARGLSEVVLDFTRERLATQVKLGLFDRDQTAELLEVMFQQAIPPAFVDSVRGDRGQPLLHRGGLSNAHR